MTIRKLKPGEATAVLQLWKAAETTDTPTDAPTDIERVAIREHVAFLVAVEGDEVVGSVIGTFDGWRGNIYRLAVHPRYQRKGIGRKLIAETERLFDAWGVRRISAIVETAHPWAVQFWESVGYTKDGRTARYGRDVASRSSAT